MLEPTSHSLIDFPNWVPRKDSDRRMSSAVLLAKTIVSLKSELTSSHLREFLSNTIWKYTECDGKYTTRFKSRGAILQPKEKQNHEHVVTRKSLVDEIIAEPARIDEIFKKAIGCTVLKSEHKLITETEKLNPMLLGWDRYVAAGVEVYDLKHAVRVV